MAKLCSAIIKNKFCKNYTGIDNKYCKKHSNLNLYTDRYNDKFIKNKSNYTFILTLFVFFITAFSIIYNHNSFNYNLLNDYANQKFINEQFSLIKTKVVEKYKDYYEQAKNYYEQM